MISTTCSLQHATQQLVKILLMLLKADWGGRSHIF